MPLPAGRYQDQLTRIKTNVRRAHDYFKPNYDRYNEFNRFIFESSLKEEEITLLMTLSKPQLEFNVLEAYISRLMGEFSKQEPDIAVNADDENTADPLTIKVLEQHLRHTLCDSSNQHTRYEVYKDILGGGFSCIKVLTDYAHPMSFNQVIKIERAYDPTLCGFDQLARMAHKGDGRFCFELFPRSKIDFEEEYPDIDLKQLNFRRDFAGFNWSYLNDSTQSLIIADYYEKKARETMIVQLRTGEVMKKSKYDEMLRTWSEFEAPPAIIGKPRKTMLESIERFRLIENMVLEHEETDFVHLPLIFVDGNSRMIKTPKNGNVRQVTRPYVYHAKGAQRLKNYAGIALANEIENIVQHKFIIKKEALPKEEELLAAIKDIQKPSNIIVNAFYENNPNQQIPEPIREIIRVPAPPETLQAFTGSDSLIQNILGSYDASLGINDNQLSGIAIVEAASQSNATAMPYIVGYLQGYQRAAQIYTDLLPKYYKTPRTIPIMDAEGKKNFIRIHVDPESGQPTQMQQGEEQSINMFYDANALNVTVKAGASFQVQKSRTIMMVKEMMGMSPLFAEFISEKGLPFVLDNMEGKGIEQLKEMVEGWLQELQQRKQQAMQQQQAEMESKGNPAKMLEQKMQLDQAKLQHEQQKSEKEFMVDMMKLQTEQVKIESDMDREREKNAIHLVQAQTQRMIHHVDSGLKHKDMRHKHLKEALETHIKHKDMEHKHKQGSMKHEKAAHV